MAASKKTMAMIVPLILLGAAFFLTPLFGIAAGSCMGYHDLVMERLRGCDQAQKVLGDGIGVGFIGMSCGSAESSGAHGHATWQLPVSGSKASGTYKFHVEKHGGGWQLYGAQLEVDETVVDVAACTPGAAGPKPTGDCRGAQACTRMGVRCFQHGDMLCAEKGFRGACDAGDKAACGNLAHILLYEKEDADGAAQAGRKGCEAGDTNACNNLAGALQKLGDEDGAYLAAKKSCSMGLDIGCATQAYFETARGDLRAAKRYANRALKKDAGLVSAHRRLGHAYLFEGEVDTAVSCYARALEAARKTSKGREVVEASDLPELDVIVDEIRALAPRHPESGAGVEEAIRRVKSMATAAESVQ